MSEPAETCKYCGSKYKQKDTTPLNFFYSWYRNNRHNIRDAAQRDFGIDLLPGDTAAQYVKEIVLEKLRELPKGEMYELESRFKV